MIERFIDHDVLARLKGFRGKFEMAGVRGGDYNQVDALFPEEFVRTAQQLGLGIFLRGLLAMTLDDMREAQVRIGVDQRRMEHPARETETDETDVERIGHAAILSATCSFKKRPTFLSYNREFPLTSSHGDGVHGASQSFAESL